MTKAREYYVRWFILFSGEGFSTWEADSPEEAERLQREEFESYPAAYLDSVVSEEIEIFDIELLREESR